MARFHRELDNLQIHLPGGSTAILADKNALENFIKCQYPGWKEKGRVTSVPEARIPQLFLHLDQMTSSLQKRYRSLQTGDDGENQVYKLFLDTAKLNDVGVMIFPNVDGNHFKARIAHVEIDLVVLHPMKGMFIVNVKNGRLDLEKIGENIERHADFIVSLAKYGNEKATIPIYSLVFSSKYEIDIDKLKLELDRSYAEKLFPINPTDAKDFPDVWQKLLSTIPDLSKEELLRGIDDLTAKLAALSSMEGSICLIHQKITNDNLQRTYKKEPLAKDLTTQMIKGEMNEPEDESKAEEIADLIDEVQHGKQPEAAQKNPRKGKGVILWSREQMNILVKVCTRLREPNGKPMRFVVSGPKGSGKTMILYYIAHLAKSIYSSRGDWNEGDIGIADGRQGSSQLLIEKLKADFDGTGIIVGSFGENRGESSKRKLLLVDEFNTITFSMNAYKQFESKGTHVILSTSVEIKLLALRSYENLGLSNSLRATGGLVRFSEDFRCLHPKPGIIPASLSHNLEGDGPCVRCISVDASKDPSQHEYIEMCLKTIDEVMMRARGLESILIVPYTHPITLERIIHGIQKHGYEYSYRNPLDFMSKSSTIYDKDMKIEKKPTMEKKLSNLPRILFATGNHVDGAEFGAVIVLLERSLPVWWQDYIFNSLYIAITRATVHLDLIVNDTKEAPMISWKQVFDNAAAKPKIWHLLNEASDADICSFTEIISNADRFSMDVHNILHKNRKSWQPALVFGNLDGIENCTPVDPKNLERNRKHRRGMICNRYTLNDQEIIAFDRFSIANCLIELWKNGTVPFTLSSVVILIHSQAEMGELFSCNRHELLFMIFEHQLASCPIYLVTSLQLNDASCGTSEICKFLSSRSHITLNDSAMESRAAIPMEEKWDVLKQQGTEYFKAGQLEDALSLYKKSLKYLQSFYATSLPSLKLETVVNLREEMARLQTNISKVYFEFGNVCNNKDLNMVETSLQFAEKSVENNPCWTKGYHRMIEASRLLKNDMVEQCAVKKLQKLKEASGVLGMQRWHRNAALKEMIETSPSWEFIKFKKNAFLVDSEGDGHFTSIKEALKNMAGKQISLLVNPGIYKGPIHLVDEEIDIVGNCPVKLESDKKWILQDPTVVLQCDEDEESTLFLLNSRLHLTRISLYNWTVSGGHALYAIISSSVYVRQCSVYSKCSAAISLDSQSHLNICQSRSVKSYGAVLAVKIASVEVKECLIQETKIIGIELREKVSASLEHCSILDCECQGIASIDSEVEIRHCYLRNNSWRKGRSEGSVQLRYTNALISNSSIMNQMGCAIVIELGSGRFENLVIDRCFNGILTQAPIHVRQCKIMKCNIAVVVCPYVNGEILLENNEIIDCRCYYQSSFSSPEPKVINDISFKLPTNISMQGYQKKFKLTTGKIFHEKIIEMERLFHSDAVYSPIGDVLGVPTKEKIINGTKCGIKCEYCTLPRSDIDFENFFLCSCKIASYCSQECASKDKDVHDIHCRDYKREVTAYRKSINWKEESTTVACCKKSSNPKSKQGKKHKKKKNKKKKDF